MKIHNSITTSTLLFVGLLLSGCGDDPKPATAPESAREEAAEEPGETKTTDVEPAVEDNPETVETAVDLEARAELMGFARYIPGDYQTYLSFRPQLVHGQLKDTRIIDWLTEDLNPAAEADGPVDFFKDCEEVVLATGSTTAMQTEVLYEITSEISQLTYLSLYERFAVEAGMMAPEEAKTGEYYSWFEVIPEQLRNNFQEYMEVLETGQMPTVILAARFNDKTGHIEEMLAEMEQRIIDGRDNPLEVIELDNGPNERLLAFHLNFSNVLDKESFLYSVEDYELTDAQFERLYTALTSKTFVFGFGKKEGYLVFFAGESVDHLKFADSLEESLVAADNSAFFDNYADKDLIYQQMASDAFAKTYADLASEPLDYYIEPMRDVLERMDVLGDKRDLMAMLDGIHSIGKEIYTANGEAMAGAGYAEDGFKLEIRGGVSSAIIDYDAPSQFAALSEDPSFAMVWASNITEEGKMNVLEVEELLGEFVSAMADRYFDLTIANEKHVELYNFYNNELAADLRKIWTAIKEEWAVGLGNEGAFVVDANGAMPKFPVIPSEFASDAKIPRVALIYPVNDRERLQNSWAEIEPSLRKVIEASSKRAGGKFTLPDPSVTENDDLRVYSYPVTGFTNDDFLPCMAVSDNYLVMSTSKVFAMELVEKMKSGTVKQSSGGQHIDINMATLRKYGRDLVEVTRKHQSILEEDEVMREFTMSITDLEYAIDTLEFLDRVKYSTTVDEEGELRTLLHLEFDDYSDAVYERITGKGGDESGDVQELEHSDHDVHGHDHQHGE